VELRVAREARAVVAYSGAAPAVLGPCSLSASLTVSFVDPVAVSGVDTFVVAAWLAWIDVYCCIRCRQRGSSHRRHNITELHVDHKPVKPCYAQALNSTLDFVGTAKTVHCVSCLSACCSKHIFFPPAATIEEALRISADCYVETSRNAGRLSTCSTTLRFLVRDQGKTAVSGLDVGWSRGARTCFVDHPRP
jgi:hypothetical protein